MKTILLILSATVIFMASFKAVTPKDEPPVSVSALNIARTSAVQMTGGELLINKSDCVGCHHKVNKLIGPAYIEIAKKYVSNDKNITYLADKIIKGGSGVWGKIPMTPHAKVSTADAKLMAKYILSIRK